MVVDTGWLALQCGSIIPLVINCVNNTIHWRIPSPSKHQRAATDPSKKGLCTSYSYYEGQDYKGPKVVLRGWMIGWTSPDRFRGWKQIEEPLADYSINGGVNAGYDEASGTYFAYMQPQGFPPEDPIGIGTGVQEVEMVRRANGFCRTKDFRHWPASKLMHPDSQDDLDIAFYAHCYFTYPGRTDLHGMLTPVFHHMTGQMDQQIAFSRDGLIWYRPERRPIVTWVLRATAKRA